jgi:hypothetical protein
LGAMVASESMLPIGFWGFFPLTCVR